MRISDWSSDVCSSDLCRHIAAYAAIPRCQYRALLEFDEQRVHDRKIVLASKGRQIIGYRQCDGWQACLSIQGPKLVFHPMRIDRKSTRLNSRSLMRSSYAVFCLKIKKKTIHTIPTN